MFVGCPFGLKTSISIFQKAMSQLFSDFPFVLIYVDDIMCFSNIGSAHIQHLKTVISR